MDRLRTKSVVKLNSGFTYKTYYCLHLQDEAHPEDGT